MIEKYFQFRKKEEKYILTLEDTDLNGDYEFYKNISPLLSSSMKMIFITGEIQKPNSTIAPYISTSTNKISEYFENVFKNNNIKYMKFYFTKYVKGESCWYASKFYGTMSDLLKINKYYGISGDYTIRKPTDSELREIKLYWK